MYQPTSTTSSDQQADARRVKPHERLQRRREQARADCRMIALLTVGDGLAWGLIASPFGVLVVLGSLLHLAIIVYLGWSVYQCSGRDVDIKHLGLALALGGLLGPIGLVLALLISAGTLVSKKSRRNLDAWYQRLADAHVRDEVSALYDSIHHGREAHFSAQDAESFLFMMNEGTFSQRQAILGIVAQKYRPELLPILTTALNGPVAALRVQAAAVKGKLSAMTLTNLKAAIGDLEQAQDYEEVAEAGQRLWQCVASGLLEPDQKERALHAAQKVYDFAQSIGYDDVETRQLFHDLQPLITYFEEAALAHAGGPASDEFERFEPAPMPASGRLLQQGWT